MKIFSKSAIAMALLSVALFSCENNQVAPEANKGGAPDLAAATGDPHPAPDLICTTPITFELANEGTGSLTVDKCVSAGVIGACTTTISWGTVKYYVGVDYVDGVFDNGDDKEYGIFDISLPTNWYVEAVNVKASNESAPFNMNGIIPGVDGSWYSVTVNPVENKYQVRIPVYELPSLWYLYAARISVVRQNLLSQVIAGSQTKLWLHNSNWNDVASASYNGISPFLVGNTATSCLTPIVTNEENTVTTGECRGCRSQVSVTFTNCESVNVTSCKDLSNVVLGFDDCTTYKYDNLTGTTGSYTAPAGKKIIAVWVKSGCYQSGDGPGFGWRVDNPNNCANGYNCTSFSN
jgi:hypothetical protein